MRDNNNKLSCVNKDVVREAYKYVHDSYIVSRSTSTSGSSSTFRSKCVEIPKTFNVLWLNIRIYRILLSQVDQYFTAAGKGDLAKHERLNLRQAYQGY